MDKKTKGNYPMVALVIPVHNNKEDTAEYLESLKGVTYPNYKVIIIDDGSTDGTKDMIKEKYPYVILLKGDGNLWWARAINMGPEKAIEIGADYVLYGDNDSIVDSKFISALLDTAEKNPRSIPVSKVYYYDDPKRILYAGGEISRSWYFRAIGHSKVDNGEFKTSYDVKWSGCTGILINTTFFEDIGMMDYKNFPQYLAAIDFTFRTYKKGYRLIFEPRSIIWDKVSSTIKKSAPNRTSFLSTFIYLTTNIKSSLNFRAHIKFYLKNCPRYLIPIVLASYALILILKSMLHSTYHLNRQQLPFPLNKL